MRNKRQHEGAIAAARRKHLRYKYEQGKISLEEYEQAIRGKRLPRIKNNK